MKVKIITSWVFFTLAGVLALFVAFAALEIAKPLAESELTLVLLKAKGGLS